MRQHVFVLISLRRGGGSVTQALHGCIITHCHVLLGVKENKNTQRDNNRLMPHTPTVKDPKLVCRFDILRPQSLSGDKTHTQDPRYLSIKAFEQFFVVCLNGNESRSPKN